MMTAKEMRERVRQYRAMATIVDDARAKKALLDLAAEYESLAEQTGASEEQPGD